MAGIGNLVGGIVPSILGGAGQGVNSIIPGLGSANGLSSVNPANNLGGLTNVNGATNPINSLANSIFNPNGVNSANPTGYNGLGGYTGMNTAPNGVSGVNTGVPNTNLYNSGYNATSANNLNNGYAVASDPPAPSVQNQTTVYSAGWTKNNWSNGWQTTSSNSLPAGFTTLSAALSATGLSNVTNGQNTIFAPTDDAFNNYLSNNNLTSQQLLANPQLAMILQNHVVAGIITPDQIFQAGPSGYQTVSLSGVPLTLIAQKGSYDMYGRTKWNIFINWTDSAGNQQTAQVVQTPVMVQNSLVYPINNVIVQ